MKNKKFILIMPMILSVAMASVIATENWLDYTWDWILNKETNKKSFVYGCFNSDEGILDCKINDREKSLI
ncbi:MAG TPA: hypothetical protein VMC80_03225 [Patescibacteria group bacterium]|nr:hypothetical protein [Patescibacteria group bacterium]